MLRQTGSVSASHTTPRQRQTVLRTILETKTHREVLSIGEDAPILEAVDKLCAAHVGALLVMHGTKPIGILSERDLLTRVLLERRDPTATHVRDVMTRDVIAVNVETSTEEVMRIMTERRCRHLPVIDDDEIVGLVSIGDVVRWMSRTQEYQIRSLEDYVTGKYPG